MSSDGSFTVTMGTADDSPEVLRRRFKVKEGETYLIRVGQPLTIYSFEDSRGRRHEKIFEIVPAEQRPSFKDLMAHPDMDGD
jgi:hypothetical protein